MQQSIVTKWTERSKEPLAHAFPKEVRFFKDRFIWPYQTGGYYVRTGYERVLNLPKWRPQKASDGSWQHLYPQLVDNLAEKHLDFDRHCRIAGLKQPEYELAFWLGQMAGEHTYNDCIDIDSHDVIGWINVPTRWHPIRMGPILPTDISWRTVPVIRPSLRFFQIAKLVHHNFPNRIWAFSSANLGLAVWAVYPKRQLVHVKHRQCRNLLRRIGLATLEHYPCPAVTKGSFGRCHRRPCGMDSGVITDGGVIVDSIQQIRCFMRPPKTPSFASIVKAYFGQLRLVYDHFLEGGEGVDHSRVLKAERSELINECLEVVAQIKDWWRTGCPIDPDLIAEATNEEHVGGDLLVSVGSADAEVTPVDQHFDGDHPSCFWEVDLEAIAKNGLWVQFTKFLVENGFPRQDTFLPVISSLAKWFLFVELHGHDQSEIEDLLCKFVAQKHNGKVSRWLAGQKQEVFRHVRRIVAHVAENELGEGHALFADIRQKRESGQYSHQYNFAPQIESDSSLSPAPFLSSHLIRGGISEDGSDKKEWQYVADNTPLPEPLQHRLLTAFQNSGRPLRRRDGEYPTLLAITRFFNYLVSGRKPGQRRASKKLLHEMGFPSKTREQQAIVKVLVPTFVVKGDYRSKTKSRLWILDKHVLEELIPEQITPEPTSTEGE